MYSFLMYMEVSVRSASTQQQPSSACESLQFHECQSTSKGTWILYTSHRWLNGATLVVVLVSLIPVGVSNCDCDFPLVQVPQALRHLQVGICDSFVHTQLLAVQ
ncbi:uncharacterized protein LOC132088251 [Daphnia carinata]|uniref:uncharacterized protein LOC132088251 n=1 Tax=Daphnia carinata TaxID=120202 RepID=UPI002869413D|nr:uncharacterized protein LOC132088251 [Daphnia carinata]